MVWFNTYDSDGDGLIREVRTYVNLAEVGLAEWTDKELGFRLAFLYPRVDGCEHETAPQEVKDEIERLKAEIERRGYSWYSNLRINERYKGWGWLPGFWKKDS